MVRQVSKEKTHKWAERIQLHKESSQNISMSHWCREQQISYDSFLYWKKRLGSNSSKIIDRSSFIELPEAPITTGITIEYQKAQIHLTKDFDSTILTKCLRALKEALC